jgi:hypothetical protein
MAKVRYFAGAGSAGELLLGVLERQNDVALEATARGSAERATSMMSE